MVHFLQKTKVYIFTDCLKRAFFYENCDLFNDKYFNNQFIFNCGKNTSVIDICKGHVEY